MTLAVVVMVYMLHTHTYFSPDADVVSELRDDSTQYHCVTVAKHAAAVWIQTAPRVCSLHPITCGSIAACGRVRQLSTVSMGVQGTGDYETRMYCLIELSAAGWVLDLDRFARSILAHGETNRRPVACMASLRPCPNIRCHRVRSAVLVSLAMQ